MVVAAAVGATFLLTRNNPHPGPTYAEQASRYLAPVLADTTRVASAVTLLGHGSDAAGVEGLVVSTQRATRSAQQRVDGLRTTDSSDQALATQIRAALTSEGAWLVTASAVLSNTASPLLSQLSGIGLDMQNKFAALSPSMEVVRQASLPSSTKIVVFVSAVNAGAQAKKAAAFASALSNQEDTAFSNQVLALLNQSTSAFQDVNTLYGQLQAAASGGYTDLTVATAEQQINAIVASRTSLAAAAQALNAPTPEAKAVSADLVTAFNDSLKDDNDLANCLNQANYGTVAYIFQGCLNASSSDNTAATMDKQTFLSAYNQLRAKVGQPASNIQF